MGELAHKETYEELTPLQKHIVDTRVNHPDWAQTEVAEKVGCDNSSVSQVERQYDHIIGEREKVLLNDRNEGGEEKTEPDRGLDALFEDLEADEEDGFQTIDKRPVKETEDDEEMFAVNITLTSEEAENVVRNEHPEGGVMDRISEAVLDEIFG